MTTARTFDESEGELSDRVPTDRKCPKCGSPMFCQVWESSDGAYEDEKYTCSDKQCLHVVWVDGIDS
jgi:hypothetical protein